MSRTKGHGPPKMGKKLQFGIGGNVPNVPLGKSQKVIQRQFVKPEQHTPGTLMDVKPDSPNDMISSFNNTIKVNTPLTELEGQGWFYPTGRLNNQYEHNFFLL